MNPFTHDAATDRLAQDNRLLLQKLDALERKLDAVLSQAEPLMPASTSWKKPPINPRQLDILHRVPEGKTNHQIARELYLTEGTIKNYLGRICLKLEAKNRAHAVTIAHARGWLEQEGAA